MSNPISGNDGPVTTEIRLDGATGDALELVVDMP